LRGIVKIQMKNMWRQLVFLCILLNLSTSFKYLTPRRGPRHSFSLYVIDEFVLQKLDSIRRTFNALTERLADPDLANDRKEMLRVSRERSAMEPTVTAYDSWRKLENERMELVELEQDPSSDSDIKEMVRQVRPLTSRMCKGVRIVKRSDESR
jgi:hypothetical protein